MPETTVPDPPDDASSVIGASGLGGEVLPQEFPSTGLPALSAEATSLESLVHHRESVDVKTPLESAHRSFRDRGVEFMAVLRAGRVVGLCSRGQIGFVMGSRFGFALYSQSPVETVLVANPLIVAHDIPVRQLLDRAMARHGDEFHEEIVLVDAEQRLLGLIRVEAVAQLQSRLVAEQLDELRRQQATLRQQNLELFRAYHAFRQSQGRYLGLFEGHTLGVALLDTQGKVHEHNRRLAELLGFTEAPGASLSLTEGMEARERTAFLALLETQAQGGGAPTTAEFVIQVPGRGGRLFRCSTGWIRETGQICACLDDITDQRALEQNVLRQEKQKLLDTLVGGIAHELNNKLTPVQGFAELLNLEAAGATRNYTEIIMRSVMEAADIIRQLLQLSKPTTPSVQAVDLCAIVEETLVMLRFQLRETPCEVQTVLPSSPVWVMADAGQLKQVGINLVLNALQAMEGRPEPVLSIEVRASGRWGLLAVTDNGCGIAPEHLGRVFDPFFTTKGSDRGSGLGLSICFSIVRQHGGEISAESEPERGARFTVSLPLERTVPATVVPARGNTPRAILAPSGTRVLVVEDEEVVRRLLQELLRSQFGCTVDLVANGLEALKAIEREDYALVLSDIRMPEMDGIEFYLRLRQSNPLAARRFVFITGHPGEQHLEAEIAQWNVSVIAKPFTLPHLAEVCGPFLHSVGVGRRDD
ncbi:MAG TPA: ATP-binding protein [Opitutaceae bacterium]|nr:ATP-binding protein [Opitutaceae bacterium]